MSLSIGIVGFPNVGKSTLYQILTKNQVGRENYPFCTITPNVGIVSVPDERVNKLAALFKPERVVFPVIKFIDIAGLIEGASKGEGLGNKFLGDIREVDLILFVIRAFEDEDVVSVSGRVDPINEIELLNTELILKDMETINNRIYSATREAKSGDKRVAEELLALEKAKKGIEDGESLVNLNLTDREKELLHPYRFLTMKPRIYLLNGREGRVLEEAKLALRDERWPVLTIDILSELEISETEKYSLVVESLIVNCYQLLNLISFFTAGSDEVRAWKIRRGVLAPEAAGVIHTDFQKKFIKADVVQWQELIEVGGIAEARKRGLIRTEGKEYEVKDGDVIEVKHGA